MANKIPFIKIEGAGNDFILLDELKTSYALGSIQSLVKSLCDRHFGIGADGFIRLLQEADRHHLTWDFYNSDGSGAEMCGNAARAVGAFYFQNFGASAFTLRTDSGLVRILPGPSGHGINWQTVELKIPQVISRQPEGILINSGVPHFIVERSSPFNTPTDYEFCKQLRAKLLQQNTSANITLVQKPYKEIIPMISFERGVENFTLACGTGALAGAYFVYSETGVNPVRCAMPGGELQVEFSKQDGVARLSGPGRVVFHGEVMI